MLSKPPVEFIVRLDHPTIPVHTDNYPDGAITLTGLTRRMPLGGSVVGRGVQGSWASSSTAAWAQSRARPSSMRS